MKKLLSLILAVVLVLSLAACAGGDTGNTTENGAAQGSQFMAGYGKADVTPTDSVPLQGYGSTEKRMSTGFYSKMFIIAVAITDVDGNTAIVLSADACFIGNSDADSIRNAISAQCKIPAGNVIISAIHQHSAPDMNNSKVSSGITYKETIFIPGAVKAAEAAMEDRAPATVQTNTVETENMNFVRHYKMEDGSYAGDNFGDWNLTPVGHASEVDNDLQLVKFVRKGQTTLSGKEAKDIILANFQGHPLMGVNNASWTVIHSDLVGVYRDALEEELDCQAIYFSGASGNVQFKSRIAEENKTSDYKAHGKKLAKYVVDAEGGYTDVDVSSVKATKVTFTGNCNHSEDSRVAEAQRVNDLYATTGDESVFRKNGFESKYHPGAIIKHANLPATRSFDLFALSIGDIAFIAAPYEMFSASGEDIKAGSPFKMTIITTIANGGQEYFPTEFAWDYGCYEQYNSNYERGTAEKLVDEYIGMLKELHSQY